MRNSLIRILRVTRYALPVTLASCGPSTALMPMETGKHWTYSVTSGFSSYVEDVNVARSISVAGVKGYVLTGPLGESRLAWKDGELVAETLQNNRFDPPLRLLRAADQKARFTWHGIVSGIWGKSGANASVDQGPEEFEIGGNNVSVVRSTLEFHAGKDKIELITMFEPGVGIVSQTQRINDIQTHQLEHTSGP